MRRLWSLALMAVVVVGLFTFVFPTRTFLAQRASISHAERQLEVLEEQNDELESRAERLRSDAEIERLAREQYNLVRPGEEAYALLPAPGTVPDADARPEVDDDDDRNLAEKAWDAVTGLF